VRWKRRPREELLRRADEAIYSRRNAAVEQERAIKENELNTEIAVENKKRQIKEAQMDADRAVRERRRVIEQEEMTGKNQHRGAQTGAGRVGHGQHQAGGRHGTTVSSSAIRTHVIDATLIVAVRQPAPMSRLVRFVHDFELPIWLISVP